MFIGTLMHEKRYCVCVVMINKSSGLDKNIGFVLAVDGSGG